MQSNPPKKSTEKTRSAESVERESNSNDMKMQSNKENPSDEQPSQTKSLQSGLPNTLDLLNKSKDTVQPPSPEQLDIPQATIRPPSPEQLDISQAAILPSSLEQLDMSQETIPSSFPELAHCSNRKVLKETFAACQTSTPQKNRKSASFRRAPTNLYQNFGAPHHMIADYPVNTFQPSPYYLAHSQNYPSQQNFHPRHPYPFPHLYPPFKDIQALNRMSNRRWLDLPQSLQARKMERTNGL